LIKAAKAGGLFLLFSLPAFYKFTDDNLVKSGEAVNLPQKLVFVQALLFALAIFALEYFRDRQKPLVSL